MIYNIICVDKLFYAYDNQIMYSSARFYQEISLEKYGGKSGVNNGQISSKNVLLVECLKQPGVESTVFRTNPFFTGNEFFVKKHTLPH